MKAFKKQSYPLLQTCNCCCHSLIPLIPLAPPGQEPNHHLQGQYFLQQGLCSLGTPNPAATLAASWLCAASCTTHAQKPSATSIPLQQPRCTLGAGAPSGYSRPRGKGKNKQRRARGCTRAIERQRLPEGSGLTRPWGFSGRNHNPVSTDPSTLPALPHLSPRAWQGLRVSGNTSSPTLCRKKPVPSLS